jgi:putative ABC transport system substrate-binding protein
MSLDHPGGNVTGLCAASADLAARRFALLRRAFPRVVRVAILWNATDPLKRLDMTQTQAAASPVGMTVLPIGVYGPDEFESAFADIAKGGADALITLADQLTTDRRDQIVALAATARLPALYERRDFVEAGGLMSYGPSLSDLFRRAAGYVERILKGARPGDLPIEPATKFDLVVNGTAAKALSAVIPPPVLKEAAEILP